MSKFFLLGRMGKVLWGFVHRQGPDFRLGLLRKVVPREKADCMPGGITDQVAWGSGFPSGPSATVRETSSQSSCWLDLLQTVSHRATATLGQRFPGRRYK